MGFESGSGPKSKPINQVKDQISACNSIRAKRAFKKSPKKRLEEKQLFFFVVALIRKHSAEKSVYLDGWIISLGLGAKTNIIQFGL